uniref:Uncharacterized protein n=1 Tax=Rhizophora mucronata TaxID=61149 RepID=A0A2P2M0Z3_RHIMU
MTQKGKWEILLKNTESRLSEPYLHKIEAKRINLFTSNSLQLERN